MLNILIRSFNIHVPQQAMMTHTCTGVTVISYVFTSNHNDLEFNLYMKPIPFTIRKFKISNGFVIYLWLLVENGFQTREFWNQFLKTDQNL